MKLTSLTVLCLLCLSTQAFADWHICTYVVKGSAEQVSAGMSQVSKSAAMKDGLASCKENQPGKECKLQRCGFHKSEVQEEEEDEKEVEDRRDDGYSWDYEERNRQDDEYLNDTAHRQYDRYCRLNPTRC